MNLSSIVSCVCTWRPLGPHCGIDVIAQHRLADFNLARKKLFNRFGKKCFRKAGSRSARAFTVSLNAFVSAIFT
jgi:hypothetical protein